MARWDKADGLIQPDQTRVKRKKSETLPAPMNDYSE